MKKIVFILGISFSAFSSLAQANATCQARVTCQSCGDAINNLETKYANDSVKENWKNKCASMGGKVSCSNWGGCSTWVCQKWTTHSFPLSAWGYTVEMARYQLKSDVSQTQKTYVCSGGNSCGPCVNGSCGSYNRSSVENLGCRQNF